jgi:hypothetical protein
MNLKDAFAGIRDSRDEAQQPEEAQAPKRPGTQAPRSLGAQAPRHLGTQAPKRLPLQGTAKSKHPEFEPVKIYIRSQTRKDATRKWEDAKGGDFSDLVEMLLQQYLGA